MYFTYFSACTAMQSNVRQRTGQDLYCHGKRAKENNWWAAVCVNKCRHMECLQQEFLGDWIDSETLQWKKAAITCRRFRGRHTYDAIASELKDIFSQYGLTTEKVTACVTDNGRNFVKAFKEYQQVGERRRGGGKLWESGLHRPPQRSHWRRQWGCTARMCTCTRMCAAHTLNLIANNEIDK